jgi:hypothetical protein
MIISGCAQLPASTVQLSNSMSNDITDMRSAHVEFVNMYMDSLENQVNQFIDNKYKPEYLSSMMDKQYKSFLSKDTSERESSLAYGLMLAFSGKTDENQPDGGPKNIKQQAELNQLQANVLEVMNVFMANIESHVESKRDELLDPLNNQRAILLSSINNNYNNIIKKNSVITALISSISDVHDTQQELLEMLGVKQNVRVEAGTKLAKLSDKVKGLDTKVKNAEGKVMSAQDKFKSLSETIKEL